MERVDQHYVSIAGIAFNSRKSCLLASIACMHHLLIQQTAAETQPLWHDLKADAHTGSEVQVQLEGSCRRFSWVRYPAVQCSV